MSAKIPKKDARNIEKALRDMTKFYKKLYYLTGNNITNTESSHWERSLYTADLSILFPQFFFTEMAEVTAQQKRQRYKLSPKYGKAQRGYPEESLNILKEKLPCREEMCEKLTQYAFQKLTGYRDTRSPLLIGPPGAGKTEMVRQLSLSLEKTGINAPIITQSLTAAVSGEHNQVEMNLLGTSSHYANGNVGRICTEVLSKDVDLCIVLLDEADKGAKNEQMLHSLIFFADPSQPLFDYCASSLCPKMDMRPKTLFILTANDTEPLQQSAPLWNRLEPIEIAPYTEKETIEILTLKGMQGHEYSGATLEQCRRLAKKIVKNHDNKDISLRECIGSMTNAIWEENMEGKEANLKPIHKSPTRKQKIGFCC